MIRSFSISDGNYKILMSVLEGNIATLLMETKMAVGTCSLHVGKCWLQGHMKGRMREEGQCSLRKETKKVKNFLDVKLNKSE